MGNDLITVIKQKQDAIAKLQAELDEAFQLLSGVAKARPTPVPKRPRSRHAKKPTPRTPLVGVEGIFPAGSVAWAVDVLRDAGKPLYVMDIIKGIEERQAKKVKKDTLVGNLSRYVKAKKLFYRAGPSMYGLIEMRKGQA